MLECVVVQPKVATKAVVILLHGLGADGHDFANIIPELQLNEAAGIKFIFPHAPLRSITVNRGMRMRAWHDIRALNAHGLESDRVGINDSIQQIEELIAQAVSEGIPESRIVLAGFSQGGAIALQMGLHKKLAGVIVLSAYLLFPNELLSASKVASPIFLAHGTEDSVVPYALGVSAKEALQAKGYPVEFHSYPMQHQVCNAEINDIAAFIKKCLAH